MSPLVSKAMCQGPKIVLCPPRKEAVAMMEFQKFALLTNFLVEHQENVFLRGGFATTTRTAKMERMNIITALLLIVNRGSFLVVNISGMLPTAYPLISGVIRQQTVLTRATNKI